MPYKIWSESKEHLAKDPGFRLYHEDWARPSKQLIYFWTAQNKNRDSKRSFSFREIIFPDSKKNRLTKFYVTFAFHGGNREMIYIEKKIEKTKEISFKINSKVINQKYNVEKNNTPNIENPR